MTTMTNESEVELSGNTKTRKAQPLQYVRWCFTYWLSESDMLDENHPRYFASLLKTYCNEFWFQLESCPKTEKLHYQGCLALKIKDRWYNVKDMIGDETVHVEHCKNWKMSVNYCKKGATRIDGPWSHNSNFLDIITHLRPWQQEIVKMIAEPADDRTIVWIHDKTGSSGKTKLCLYLAVKFNIPCFPNAKSKDIAYSISKLDKTPQCICFNLARDTDLAKFNYNVIESIKDGILFSSKYKSNICMFNSPHVIIMANDPPLLHKLSSDRWLVLDI